MKQLMAETSEPGKNKYIVTITNKIILFQKHG